MVKQELDSTTTFGDGVSGEVGDVSPLMIGVLRKNNGKGGGGLVVLTVLAMMAFEVIYMCM
jgi:hypothetical protein